MTKTEIIKGTLNIDSKNLDLNELLEEKTDERNDTTYRLEIDPRLNLNMHVNVGIISFKKFQAWQLAGDIKVSNKILSTNNLKFKACEGRIELDGEINATERDSLSIKTSSTISSVNITEMFGQMGNFGQKVITEKNVKGILNATIQFSSRWSKNLNCNTDKIYAKSNLSIEKGELNNFEPMLALSKYIKGTDLKQIKFNTLRNQIEIKNRTIFIPKMEIACSAMDLIASGTHTFDNIIDYHLQINLSQLLGKKVREMNTEFGKIEDDGLGKMKLMLTMKGDIRNPKINLDRKGIGQKIKEDIINEKQQLKKILKEEFNWLKKDPSKSNNNQLNKSEKPKKEELEIETE